MTTDEWEALLAGTTPRPWVIGATLKDPLVDVSAGTYEDARLAAQAPTSVAEVVRLRREIIAMRDRLRNTARVFTYKDLGRCNPHDDMADDLTRILEGEV